MTISILYLFASQLYAQQTPRASEKSYGLSPYDIVVPDQSSDSLLIIASQVLIPVVFEVNKYQLKPTSQLNATLDSIQKYRDNIVYIWIGGSASPDGPQAWNNRLSQLRAESLSDFVADSAGLERSMLRVCNLGEDWRSLEEVLKDKSELPNRERILELLSAETDHEVRKQKIREIDGGKTWRRLIDELFPPFRNARLAIVSAYPKMHALADQMPLWESPNGTLSPDQISLTPYLYAGRMQSERRCPNWKIAIKNNLLFDAALVANLGVEISPCTHWSLDIPVWYSPYNISSTRNIRLLAVQPEIRWWFKEAMDGHFVGLHTHVVGFNIALNDYARYQDPNYALWGLGVSYGYAMSLGKSEHWGLEFTLGAGFARYQYDAYRNESNGEKFASGSDCYWGITRAGVTLSYKWTLSRRNRKN